MRAGLLCILEEARVYPSSGPARLARRALLYLCEEKTQRPPAHLGMTAGGGAWQRHRAH